MTTKHGRRKFLVPKFDLDICQHPKEIPPKADRTLWLYRNVTTKAVTDAQVTMHANTAATRDKGEAAQDAPNQAQYKRLDSARQRGATQSSPMHDLTGGIYMGRIYGD